MFLVVNILMVLFCLGASQAELAAYKLRCGNAGCSLEPKKVEGDENQMKLAHAACVNYACTKTLAVSDSQHLFECQLDFVSDTGSNLLSSIIMPATSSSQRHISPLDGHCQKLSETPVGEALVNLALKEVANGAFAASSSEEADEDKRELPFETMNYGKKRQLPFETLNYGKRNLARSRHPKCECDEYKRETGLPFDSILLGKKSLPFETLNYGKRSEKQEKERITKNKQERAAYIPIDGYIMGKRTGV